MIVESNIGNKDSKKDFHRHKCKVEVKSSIASFALLT